jgi:hypothetical protein
VAFGASVDHVSSDDVSAAVCIGTWLWAAVTTTTPTVATAPTPVDDEPPAVRVRLAGAWFSVAAPPSSAVPDGSLRVRVMVQDGLEPLADDFAATVEEVLADGNGWAAAGRPFAVVEQNADIDVVLARPQVVDELCAPLLTGGSFSCGRKGRAVINVRRWRGGSTTFGKDLASYRQYVVNHEVGHLLGFDHEGCPGRGRRAPIMLQQTKSLAGCRRSTLPNAREIAALGSRVARPTAPKTTALPTWDAERGGGAGRLAPP